MIAISGIIMNISPYLKKDFIANAQLCCPYKISPTLSQNFLKTLPGSGKGLANFLKKIFEKKKEWAKRLGEKILETKFFSKKKIQKLGNI